MTEDSPADSHDRTPACSQASGAVERLPFGPYAGFSVAEVAVVDPDYLLALVREAVGSAELRAAAGQALACRGLLSHPGRSLPQPSLRPERRPAPSSVLALPAAHQQIARQHCGDEETIQAPNGGVADRRRVLGLACRHPWVLVLTAGLAALLGLGVGQAMHRLRSVEAPLGLAGRVESPAGLRRELLPTQRDHLSPTAEGPGSGVATGGVKPDDGGSAAGAMGLARGGTAAVPFGSNASSSASGLIPLAAGSPIAAAGASSQAALADRPCGMRSAGAIPAALASQHVDTFQAVEFEVVRTKDTGRVTYLNSHEPYAGHFYVAIFPGDYERFSQPPAILFRGKCIVVQGMIETYRGTPQIVLRSPEDVRILEE